MAYIKHGVDFYECRECRIVVGYAAVEKEELLKVLDYLTAEESDFYYGAVRVTINCPLCKKVTIATQHFIGHGEVYGSGF